MNRLRPEPHRGELIAAGGVLLAVAVVVLDVRMSRPWASGVFLLIDSLAAALLVGMGLLADPEWREEPQAREGVSGTAPSVGVRRSRAFVGVLLLAGFALVVLAVLDLARVLGAHSPLSTGGTLFWVSGVLALKAGAIWRIRAFPVFVLLASLFGGLSALEFVRWAFHPTGVGAYRVVLLLLILLYAALHARLRETRRREAVLLVDAAGASAILLGLTVAAGLFGSLIAPRLGAGANSSSPTGWQLVVLVVGCLLVAFAAVEREPGPGFLGVITLVVFAFTAGIPSFDGASLVGWPLFLLVLAAVVLAAGLRPSVPAPPEPPGPGTGGTVPLRPQEPTP